MAEINYNKPVRTTNTITVTWETIDGGDTGKPFEFDKFNDLSVQVTGTFDSNTLTMQGSNDGTNYVTLKDYLGLDVTFTAAGASPIGSVYKYIRPSLGSGANSDIDVTVYGIES